MNLPYHCILADQYRAFPERAEKWRRVKVPESDRTRLAGNIVLRRFALPAPYGGGRGRRLAFISDLLYLLIVGRGKSFSAPFVVKIFR